MCLRKISAIIVSSLVLTLLTPIDSRFAAHADSGKKAAVKAIIVQPGEEIDVTDIVSGPSPQKAEATGLDAAGGKDRVSNLGIVRAEAGAETTVTTRGATAGTRSVGINGSGGKDSILNGGTLSSKANSTVTSISLFISVDGFTLPFMRKFPPVTGGSLAESFAAGILGGNGNDVIEHSGAMTVEAASTAAAGSINVSLAGRDEKVLSKAIPAIWAVKPPVMKADAPGKAVTETVGIDGGRGDDSILSTGTMTVKASAFSGAGSLDMNLGNDARVNLSAEAIASATGIRATEGKDEVVNQGALAIEASATAGAGAVSASFPTDRGIYGLPERPPAGSRVQIPFFTVRGDLSGKATAFATGIESGAADARISNSGPILSRASTTAAAGSIAVGVADSVEGSVAALSRAETGGIRSGSGNDVVLNSGELTVEAKAVAGAGSISVGVRNPEETAEPSNAKADASGTAESLAAGIETGSGADLFVNTAAMSVKASSTVGAGSISVGVGGSAESNVSAKAGAAASGILGGEDNDTIQNDGAISAEAAAVAAAGSIAVGVQDGGTGESPDVKADASAKADTFTAGIDGETGADWIFNRATMKVKSSATSAAGAVAVNVGGNAEGDVSAESIARAAGIRGGEGDDAIRSEGILTAEASAIAGAGSIGVAVSTEGGSAAAKADASGKAKAMAVGISGGGGDDNVVNVAPLNVKASSTVGTGSIGVSVGGDVEGNLSAEAISRVAGIRGGEGADSVRNEGTLTVEASAIAGAGSISVGVKQENGEDPETPAGTQPASEALPVKADASAKATAAALGIGGGAGHDAIVNIAPADVKASSTVGAGSIAVGVGTSAEANVSAEAISRAAGIVGGEGDDSVRNEGALTVKAESIVGAGSISVGVSGDDESGSAAAKADASGKAKAATVGLSGGRGDDRVVNMAPIDVKASSTVGAGSIGVSVGGDVEGNVSAEALARAAGIRGGGGNDEIVNQGGLTVEAKSVAVAGSISVGVDSGGGDENGQNETPPEPPSLETSSVKADASAASKALAAGIGGGEGDNRITNTAPMTVTSTATTVAGSIAVNVSGFGGGDDGGEAPSGGENPEMPELALSSAKTDASAKAEARAAGIKAGSGFDTIISGGVIAIDATSTAVAAGISVNVAKMDKGLSGSAALADAGAEAIAAAVGIDGGDGDNRISNSAAIGAKATATAVGVGVSVDVGLADKGAALGAAIADSGTTAETLATGIRGGAGQDRVVNTGVITPNATANATAVSVGLTVTNADKGLAASAALADANAMATATARGIETGAGDDVILNDGAIAPKAKAGTTAVGVTVGVGVTQQGVSLGASLAESDTVSTAATVGIESGSGNDRVSNTGQITLDARSSGTAVSVGVGVTYAKQGVGASVALVDAQSAADATARGIEAGDGGDKIVNSGTIQGIAKADTTSVGVAASVGIAKQGLAAGVGLSDTSTSARASSVGIDGGRGEDRIVNEGEINLGLESGFGSVADANAVSVSVTVAGASQGLAGAAALSKSSATGVAATTGIYGGEGSDEIHNAGKIDVGAKADVDSTNVAVGVTVAKEGLAGGAALSDASALSAATAKGIDGAEGDDLILNAGEIKTRAESRADTVSVTAIIAGTKTGLAGGAALSDSTSASVADAAGLSGGAGKDRIYNTGTVVSGALADSDTTSVTVGLTVAKEGVAGGAALSDASSSTVSAARGIDGGDSDDWIDNEGKIEAKAESYADTVSVTATLSGAMTGVAGGVSLSDSSALATSTARGIEGGAGHDRIQNEGDIDATAESWADTTSVTIAISGSMTGVAGGAAISDAAAGAVADAAGLSSGDGNDQIVNTANVTALAKADVDSTAVTVGLSVSKEGVSGGAALSDASSSAWSAARGIDGGAGDDRIRNEGAIEATSTASADTTSVSVRVDGSLYGAAGGVAMSDSSAAAVAQSTGILGGAGNDAISNTAKVTAQSTANADATSVSVRGSGSIGLAAGASFSDASVSALATSRGIDGADGSDFIVNEGELVSRAGAVGDSTSVSVSVSLGLGGGASFSDSSAFVGADAKGIDGGRGHDRIYNTGPITVDASSDADASSVSVNVGGIISAGAALGDASVVSKTVASGIDGGEGNDEIWNEGMINSGTMSRVDADSVSVNVGIGWAEATVHVASETTASGIEGGEGDDLITNKGEIHVGPSPGPDGWMSRVTASSFSFGLAGVADAQSSVLATTRSKGIDGGAGNDRIRNEGLLNVLASSYSSVDADSVVIFGTSSGSVKAGAVTEALGIGGGAGNDCITNASTITAKSVASMSLDSSSFSFAGTGDAGGTLDAITRSTGVSGGEGNDGILNEGTVDVTATSTLSSKSKSIVIFGSSQAGSTSRALTEAAGIDGGTGADGIHNTSSITVTATATMTQDNSSFSFGGTGNTGGTLAAITRSTGISGGDGSDFIRNDGSLIMSASSSLTSKAKATVVFGSSEAGSTSGAVTEATGISGGAGDDRVENNGAIGITSSSWLTQSSSSFSFGGTGASGATLTATTLAKGISGGDGADQILNNGSMTLQANSTLKTESKSTAVFGTSSGAVTSGGVSQAVGIDGGAGNDRIWNAATIYAGSSSTLSLKESGYTFGGSSGAKDALTATSLSEGISGGAGANGIRSEGVLTVSALANLDANVDVDATFGTTQADGVTTAVTKATGLSGGEKGDCIENLSVVGVTSTTVASVDRSSFVFGGSAKLKGLVVTNARADGITAGDGDNRVLNALAGTVDVKAVSTAEQSGSSSQTFGGPYASADVTTGAYASGLISGIGDDWILNRGKITVDAYAKADGATSADTFWGSSKAYDYTRAEASAAGLDAGSGNNVVVSEGSISVRAAAETLPDAWSNSDVERTTAVAASASTVTASGIVTGGGRDRIMNRADLTVEAVAEKATASDVRTKASTDEMAYIGDGPETPGIIAEAKAEGISAGDGDNVILNERTLKVTATATGDGKAYAESDLYDTDTTIWEQVSSTASGVTTGKGSSLIVNQGLLQVGAYADSITDTTSDSIDDATANGGATVSAKASGVRSTGTGTMILNSGMVDVDASSNASGSFRADSGGDGYGKAYFGISSSAEATGISGGDGGRVVNQKGARIEADAKAAISASANGDEYGIMGSSRDDLGSTATARATGIAMGSGNSVMVNEGSMAIHAEGNIDVGTRALSTTRSTHTQNWALSDAYAAGMTAGTGSHVITNTGELEVKATGITVLNNPGDGTGTYWRSDSWYNASAKTGAYANSRASGIDAGADNTESPGVTIITNSAPVGVTALSTAKGNSRADSGDGDGIATTYADAAAEATGIAAGSGNKQVKILNEAPLTVEAAADSLAFAHGDDDSYSYSKASASTVGIKVGDNNVKVEIYNAGPVKVRATADGRAEDDEPTMEAEGTSKAYGIRVGNSSSDIVHTGAMDVASTASATFQSSNDSVAENKSSADAGGIITGDGTQRVFVDGQITVSAIADNGPADKPYTVTTDGANAARATVIGIRTGSGDDTLELGKNSAVAGAADAKAVSVTAAADAKGIGLDAGDGTNRIVNYGSIGITADASGITARAEATGLKAGTGADQIEIHGSVTSRAEATALLGSAGTIAVGIDAGGGDNRIFSDSVFDTRSIAVTGGMGEAEATAFGVRAGTGSDRIENSGSLSILSDATTAIGVSDATATGIEAGNGDNVIRNGGTLAVTARSAVVMGSTKARAYGILTGEGNDTVVNAGRILTSQAGIGAGITIETPGTAISTGGGNDRVFLETGSETRGRIDLGEGDDTITFTGILAVTDNVMGGSGSDTLVFSGAGSLGSDFSGFEAVTKDGAGTYVLGSLPQVKRLEMNSGTLEVSSSYRLAADGTFQARVNSDGSHGQLKVNGTADLDGALSVVRGTGVYLNGTKYPILVANTVSGGFTSQTLPAPTPLLSFQVKSQADRVEVEALAKSFTTVAKNPLQMNMACQLDKAMTTATGDAAVVLGQFQALPAGDIQKAFASLSPDSYRRFRKTVLAANRQNVRSLHDRMTSLRLTGPGDAAALQARSLTNTLSLFHSGSDQGIGVEQAWQLGKMSGGAARSGSWMNAFGQQGNLPGESGGANSDYRFNGNVMGFDQPYSDTLVYGFSGGVTQGHIGIEDRGGAADLRSAFNSFYGNWFAHDTYMETALSYARNQFDNYRGIVVGPLQRVATAEHEGDVFTAYLSGGRYFRLGQWVIEPHASLLYTDVYEEGFKEDGAGAVSLMVHDSHTKSLVSDVGLRVTRSFETPYGRLIPDAGLFWDYDFGLSDDSITASFAGIPGTEFSIPGEETVHHGARFEAGLSLIGSRGFTTSLKYVGEFRRGNNDQGIFGLLVYEF